jgi:PAS domain S-box-containing protein
MQTLRVEEAQGPSALAAAVADQVDAMLAYWDKDLVCRFANQAYIHWFGRTPEEMIGKLRMPDLLGPLFEMNKPFVDGALRGERQTFEREIKVPSGEVRYSLANYYPDTRGGEVAGFSVHVADVTGMKKLARERERLIAELSAAIGEIKDLKGLLPICAWCKKVRDDNGYWNQIEAYIAERSEVSFTHAICSDCATDFREP